MISTRTILPLLALAATSCGGGAAPASGPGNPGTGPTGVTQYCTQLWDTYAARWAACWRASPAHAAATWDPATRCGNMIQAVSAGRATYDAASAGSCLAFIETATCDQLEGWMDERYGQASCRAAVKGKLGDGASCYSGNSCASGLCQEFIACPFSCKTVVSQGTQCGASNWCEPGSYCNTAVSPWVCAPLLGQGATCGGFPICAAGLQCVGASPPFTCQPLQTSGACMDSAQCAIGYHCAGSACVAWLKPGDGCTQGTNACGPGLWCDGTGKCVDGSTGTGPCGLVNGELRPCIGGTCGGTSCVPWTPVGGACTSSPQCAPVTYCAGTVSPVCAYPCVEP